MTTPAPTRSAFSRFFTDARTVVDTRVENILILNQLSRVLLVEAGAVDLFAVRLVDGQPTGRWHALTRVTSGAMIFVAPGGPRHALVGRPVPGAHVSFLPLAALEGLSARRAVRDSSVGHAVRALSASDYAVAVQQFISGTEQGIVALTGALRTELPPREFVPLHLGEPTLVAAGDAVRSIDGVLWVTVAEGMVSAADGVAGHLTAGGGICVTERDWLIAADNSSLISRQTRDLLAEGTIWAQLITHATRYLYSVDRWVERQAAEERADLQRQVDAAGGTLGSATQAFNAVLRDTQAKIKLGDVATDSPALAAVRLVASHLEIPVRAPSGPDPGARVSPIARITRASGIMTRTIRLDDGWWRRDLGPFIAERAGDGRPLAVLPSDGSYVMALPEENRVVRVNGTVARTLKRRATVLYRPLPSSVQSIPALLRFGLRGARRDLWRLGVTGLGVALLGLLVPIMTGAVLGTYVGGAQRSLIVEGSLLVIGGGIVAAVLSAVQNIAALRLEGRSAADLQAAIWARVLSLPAPFFGRFATGELATATLGITAAQEQLSGVLTTAALGLMAGLANLVLLFVYDLRLALIATGLVAIGAGASAIASRYELRWQRSAYQYEQRLSSRVFQLLTGLPKLRVAAAEDRAFTIWAGDFTRSRGVAVSARRMQNIVTTFNAGFPLICSVVIFALVGGPFRGTVTVATFLAFYTAFNLMIAAVLQFTGVAITTIGIVPMLERITPLLAERPELDHDRADPGDLSGRIALSHVSFGYGEDAPLVLNDVTITAEPGEFVAIVGPTGCGKSTILRLLLGFERPSAGSVLYDGQDLAELDVAAVRRQCGVVLQNGALLAGDIQANIIGSTTHTADDAWAAARMAGIADEIAAMPMGMHTIVSEGSSTLSGGQRQRIMIARALVSRPRMIFFDEATSALDNPAQQVIAESTRRLNATRIVIAHRLSTVSEADKIIVLDGGRIVQQGTYDDLIADHDGVFARLATWQLV